DVAIPRNRVRAELLPLLAARFNPSIVDVLADQATLARDVSAWMDAEAAALALRAVHPVPDPGSDGVRHQLRGADDQLPGSDGVRHHVTSGGGVRHHLTPVAGVGSGAELTRRVVL